MWQPQIYVNITKWGYCMENFLENEASRNLKHLEVGETGISSVNRRNCSGGKTNRSTGISAIMLLPNEGTVNEQFEIAAVSDHKQGILLLAWSNCTTAPVLYEIRKGPSISAGIVVAEKELPMFIDPEVIILMVVGAEDQTRVAPREQ